MSKPAKSDYQVILTYTSPHPHVPALKPGEWADYPWDEVSKANAASGAALAIVKQFVPRLARHNSWKPVCWYDDSLSAGARRLKLTIGVPNWKGLNYVALRNEFTGEIAELARVCGEVKAKIASLRADVAVQDKVHRLNDRALVFTPSNFVVQQMEVLLYKDGHAQDKRQDSTITDEEGVALLFPGAPDTNGFATTRGKPGDIVGRIEHIYFNNGPVCDILKTNGKGITARLPAHLYDAACRVAKTRDYVDFEVTPEIWTLGYFEYVDIYNLKKIAHKVRHGFKNIAA